MMEADPTEVARPHATGRPETAAPLADEVRILFFGRFRALAGQSLLRMPWPEQAALSHLRARLIRDHPRWDWLTEDPLVKIALNADLLAAGADPVLRSGDEIAFMPVFSGG